MAWNSPVTYTVNQVLTSANLNTYLSGNMTFLYNILHKLTADHIQVHQLADGGGNGIQSWDAALAHYAELVSSGGITYLTADGVQSINVNSSGDIAFTGGNINSVPWPLEYYSAGPMTQTTASTNPQVIYQITGLTSGGIYIVALGPINYNYGGGNNVGTQSRLTCNNGGTVLINNWVWGSSGGSNNNWIASFFWAGTVTGTTVEIQASMNGDGPTEWRFYGGSLFPNSGISTPSGGFALRVH